jgi:hypothetical protein
VVGEEEVGRTGGKGREEEVRGEMEGNDEWEEEEETEEMEGRVLRSYEEFSVRGPSPPFSMEEALLKGWDEEEEEGEVEEEVEEEVGFVEVDVFCSSPSPPVSIHRRRGSSPSFS